MIDGRNLKPRASLIVIVQPDGRPAIIRRFWISEPGETQ